MTAIAVAEVTRRSLRHGLIRARNGRVLETRLEEWPVAIHTHRHTWIELMVDDDPAELLTLADPTPDGGRAFMGIPVHFDDRLVVGEYAVHWPRPKPIPEAYL